MLRKLLAVSLAIGFANAVFAAETPAVHANMTAAEIVSRNVAARGGLQTWRAVKTLSESGKLGAGGDQRGPVQTTALTPPGRNRQQPLPVSPRLAKEAQLPFVMEMERPRKLRFELRFAGKTAIQVYDGTNGWKVRPFLNRVDVEPYTASELKMASMQSDLDGPLIDCAAKGARVELDGMETVENRPTYKLKLTKKDGQILHVWIDAETFLEAKIEGQPRRLDGKMHPVEIYYRDYRPVNGLEFPFVLETKVLPVEQGAAGAKEAAVPAEQIVIEKIVVNPRLDASEFAKPVIAAGAAPAHPQGL